MTRGVLSLADLLGLRLDHAGEFFGCDFGGAGDCVGGPVDLDVGDAADGAVVTGKGGGGLRQGYLGGGDGVGAVDAQLHGCRSIGRGSAGVSPGDRLAYRHVTGVVQQLRVG